MSEETSGSRDLNPAEDTALIEALHTAPLSSQSLERVRAAVEREWLASVRKNRPAVPTIDRAAPRWTALAAAAALSAVALATWFALPHEAAPTIGAISRVEGSLAVHGGLWDHRELRSGDRLQVGDRLTAGAPALVALTGGGTLRIAAGSRLTIAALDRLALERGQIYLDFPPQANPVKPLRVITPVGAIEHVGTEFEIESNGDAVRVRVREGRVRFLGATKTLMVDAGTEIVAAPGRQVVQRAIETYGRDWLWTTALAPDYEIEGRPLTGFLLWACRELGRTLDFADADAQRVADQTVLHGSVRRQAPFDAISNVLATTSLTYEIRGNTIRVRSSKVTAL